LETRQVNVELGLEKRSEYSELNKVEGESERGMHVYQSIISLDKYQLLYINPIHSQTQISVTQFPGPRVRGTGKRVHLLLQSKWLPFVGCEKCHLG